MQLVGQECALATRKIIRNLWVSYTVTICEAVITVHTDLMQVFPEKRLQLERRPQSECPAGNSRVTLDTLHYIYMDWLRLAIPKMQFIGNMNIKNSFWILLQEAQMAQMADRERDKEKGSGYGKPTDFSIFLGLAGTMKNCWGLLGGIHRSDTYCT